MRGFEPRCEPYNEVVNGKLNVVALVVTSGQAMSQLTDRHWEYHRQAVPSIPMSSWSFPSRHLPLSTPLHLLPCLPILPSLPIPYIPLILSSFFPSISHSLTIPSDPLLPHPFPLLYAPYISSHPFSSRTPLFILYLAPDWDGVRSVAEAVLMPGASVSGADSVRLWVTFSIKLCIFKLYTSI